MAYNPDTLSFTEPATDMVYIAGLPEGITEEDMAAHFGTIGLLKQDKKKGKPKIWLYRDKATGALKVARSRAPCVVADRLLGHMSVPPLSSAQQRETQATRRAPYQRRAGRQGDGTVSYEDPFSAASAVQWFNGKDFRGAPAGLSAHTAAQPARRPSHPPVQCRLCLAGAALAVPLSPARRPQARRSR